MAPVGGVELGRALQRVGQPAKLIAHGRGAGGQGARGRVPVEIAPAGDGTLATDVEGGQRVQLPGVRDTGDHPELLRHGRIGGRRLHTPEFEGRPRVFVEIGQDRGRLDGVRRKAQRRLRAHGARRFRDRRAVGGDEPAGDPVIGACAREIVLHDRDAGGLP